MPVTRFLTACSIVAMVASAALAASAQQFALQTGPPVAAMPDPTNPGVKKFKDAVFVVRSGGCADLSDFLLTARTEGVQDGVRRTAQLALVPLPQQGVFAVTGTVPKGTWVVALSGTCGSQVAGATVRLAGKGYRRDGVELLPHHPTPADVERALAGSAGADDRR